MKMSPFLYATGTTAKRPVPQLIKGVIAPSQFYPPPRPQQQEKAAEAALCLPVAEVPSRPRPRTRPLLTAVEKMEVERQRVGLSRAVSRRMKIPTSGMCPADYFVSVNVENMTEQCARYAYWQSQEETVDAHKCCPLFIAGTCSAIGPSSRT